MPASLPVSLFVPHGAPTMALQDPPGPAARALRKLGVALTRRGKSGDDDGDKSIAADGDTCDSLTLVVASAHYTSSRSVSVSSPASAASLWGTEHDFYGFPKELYEIQYPVRGDEEVAAEAARLLERARIRVEPAREAAAAALQQKESESGVPAPAAAEAAAAKSKLDHGAWTPLSLMFPDATESNISVVTVSLQPSLGPRHALAVGRALAPLVRNEDEKKKRIVVLRSGNLTHNLADWRRSGDSSSSAPPYVRRFADKVWERLQKGDVEALLRYRGDENGNEDSENDGKRAHPTEEHLLPLFVALGAASSTMGDNGLSLKRVERFHSGVEEGILAMDGFAFY